MNKVMNNISTIVCNDLFGALEINFNKSGELQEYNESMQLAMDLSIIHQVNKWIINKSHFQDLKIESFLMLIFSWAKIVKNRNNANQKVIIVTTSEMFNKINRVLKKDWWQRRYSRSDISIQPFFNKKREVFTTETVK